MKGRYRLGLLSNSIVEYARRPLEHLGLERIGAKPSEAMMVGDSLLEDVAASQRVGMTAVWVNRSGEPSRADVKPDYTIGDLRALLELLGEVGVASCKSKRAQLSGELDHRRSL